MKNTETILFRTKGFSLIEVVLAIGIFMVTGIALVGLLGPVLKVVDDVEERNELSSVVHTVDVFLQWANEDIALPDKSKFETIYDALQSDGFATVFVFREYINASTSNLDETKLKVGFYPSSSLNEKVCLSDDVNDSNAVGKIYRVVLTPSGLLPVKYYKRTGKDLNNNDVPKRDPNTGVYELKESFDQYEEGYFPMEVRIFAEDPGLSFVSAINLEALHKEREPVFTYHLAIVR